MKYEIDLLITRRERAREKNYGTEVVEFRLCFIPTVGHQQTRISRYDRPNIVEYDAPLAIAIYNKYMGGVDAHDQLRTV